MTCNGPTALPLTFSFIWEGDFLPIGLCFWELIGRARLQTLILLRRSKTNTSVDLEKYDPPERQTFVNELLDTESNRLGKQFRDRLFWYTKGHPLFTVELLRHLQERGNLVQDASGQWIEKAAFESGDLPVRVEAVIQQRIGHLNPIQQELLTIAAVEGEVCSGPIKLDTF
jgi:predicted ATPase